MRLSVNGHLTIKSRVTAWFAIIMLIIASAVFYVMIAHRTSQVKADAERNLISAVNDFTDMAKRTDGDFSKSFEQHRRPEGKAPVVPPQDGASDSRLFGGEDKKPRTYVGGVHIAIFSENGETLLGQIPFGFETIDFEDDRIRSLNSDSERYLVLDRSVQTSNGNIWVKGVINISGALNAVNSTLATDYCLITVLILIAAVGGYFIVGKALAPIAKMRRTAQEIADSSDLSRRIDLGQGKDEVYRLAAVFDEMLDKIERSFEAEKQFTSDASHELRTPVAVILSECEYALDCAKTKEEFQDSLAVVKRQGDKMSRLISKLLAISRMDRSSLVPDIEEIDLSELAEIVCDEQIEICPNDIALVRSIAPNIKAKADSALIARLFINLISNAFQYGKKGGRVTVSLCREGENAVFTVADNGIGIAEDELDKIWERFYRVNKSRSNENGSMGLGLSMVKQIAALHRGSVSVTSTVGVGSTFTFTMPTQL